MREATVAVEERWSVPHSWTWAPTGLIADVVGGGTPSANDTSNFSDHGIAWITPADLTGFENTYIARGARDLSPKGYKSSSARLLPSGTVLFSSRAPIGYCVIALEQVATNQGFKSFVLKGEIQPEFLRHYLRASIDYAESLASGTTFKELSGSRAAEMAVPIAPLAEQRRIVTKIDSLSAKSKRARDHLEHVPALVQRYKSAILRDAFQGKLSYEYRRKSRIIDLKEQPLNAVREERYAAWVASKKSIRQIYVPPRPMELEEAPHSIPAGWSWAVAEEIVQPGSDIVYGIVQPGPKLDEGVPYVRGTDIENGIIKIDQLLFTSEVIAEKYSRASLEGGDVLLGIIRATKVAIVPDELSGANITQGTARLRPSQAIITKFLARWLEGDVAQRWLHSKYRGIDMPGLNLRDVRRCPVPIAPVAEQAVIVDILNSTFAWIDRLAAEATSARKLIEHLDQATLSKAFRGELVAQDPADEPASVLLERIKAERVGSVSARRGRGRPRLAPTT